MPEYIERDALLGEIQTMRNQHLLSKCDGAKIERMARKLPAADVAPVVHGRWGHLGGDEWCCTHCGCVISTEGSWEKPEKKYCDNCGAKMDLKNEMEEK